MQANGLATSSGNMFNSLFTYPSWLGAAGMRAGLTGTATSSPSPRTTGTAASGTEDVPDGTDGKAVATGTAGAAPTQAVAVTGGAVTDSGGARPRPLLQLMERLNTRQVSLWTLLVVALLSFLLGSLLRSMVGPADFVYLPPEHVALSRSNADETTHWRELQRLVELNHRDRWREMKRLIEFRGPLGRWDVVLAVIRR